MMRICKRHKNYEQVKFYRIILKKTCSNDYNLCNEK